MWNPTETLEAKSLTRFRHSRNLPAKSLTRFRHSRNLPAKSLTRFRHSRNLPAKSLTRFRHSRNLHARQTRDAFSAPRPPLWQVTSCPVFQVKILDPGRPLWTGCCRAGVLALGLSRDQGVGRADEGAFLPEPMANLAVFPKQPRRRKALMSFPQEFGSFSSGSCRCCEQVFR
jgi:hypothetical protein